MFFKFQDVLKAVIIWACRLTLAILCLYLGTEETLRVSKLFFTNSSKALGIVRKQLIVKDIDTKFVVYMSINDADSILDVLCCRR